MRLGELISLSREAARIGYRAMLAAAPSPGKDGPGEEEIEAAAKRLWNVMRNKDAPEWEELARYEDKPQDDFRKGARAVLRL